VEINLPLSGLYEFAGLEVQLMFFGTPATSRHVISDRVLHDTIGGVKAVGEP
jgi:hypothetical protein